MTFVSNKEDDDSEATRSIDTHRRKLHSIS